MSGKGGNPNYKHDRQVLHLLDTSPKPLGAYDLAQLISGRGRRVQPASIYRSLDRLVAAGEVIKLVSKNAFCRAVDGGGSGVALIVCCIRCERYEIIRIALAETLGKLAHSRAFRVARSYVECFALCASCTGSASDRYVAGA
jgi:Fur family zinc uptake transcriptional regulator